MADVYRTVEIWHKRHTEKIIRLIGKTFHDTNIDCNDVYVASDDDDHPVFSDDLLGIQETYMFLHVVEATVSLQQ